jgi:hypothetical protein
MTEALCHKTKFLFRLMKQELFRPEDLADPALMRSGDGARGGGDDLAQARARRAMREDRNLPPRDVRARGIGAVSLDLARSGGGAVCDAAAGMIRRSEQT